MPRTRSERRLRRLGLIVTTVGFVLSGFGVSALVSLLPLGILIALAGMVLLMADAAGDLES